MDPTVVAAWIAAGVSVLTLVGTLAAQYFGPARPARTCRPWRASATTRSQQRRPVRSGVLDNRTAWGLAAGYCCAGDGRPVAGMRIRSRNSSR
jgi:hypothetical protein